MNVFQCFTDLASWLVYTVFGLAHGEDFPKALHFFIEDTTKIFALLLVLIYAIGIARASLNVERVRDFLQGKHRLIGYGLAAMFGAVTPFCSCSSIPLFLGFTAARIPIGFTMAFLITSPIINEVAVVLLGTELGAPFTIAYVIVGIAAGMLGGWFFDFIKAERYLTDLAGGALDAAEHAAAETDKTPCECNCSCDSAPSQTQKLSWPARRDFARTETATIIKRIWKWVILGIAAGAALHGYVPREWIVEHLGDGQWWSVPAATLLGIPLYSNASGIIPVAKTLLDKGLPVGTTLAFMMSVVAASFPEFVLLPQVMKPRLLLTFFLVLRVLFTLVGWGFNAAQGILGL